MLFFCLTFSSNINIAFGWNADLSTLASVVTSLAGMRSEAFGGVSSNPMNHRGASPADRPDRGALSADRHHHHHHHHHERGGSGGGGGGGGGQNVKMEEEDDSDDEDSASTTNDEAAVANALHLAKENLISKAFDTMAKVCHLYYFFYRRDTLLLFHFGNVVIASLA